MNKTIEITITCKDTDSVRIEMLEPESGDLVHKDFIYPEEADKCIQFISEEMESWIEMLIEERKETS